MSLTGVPNTTTFTLADVIAAVNPSSNNLQECFNDAVSGAFNTTYDEDKDELDDFRDYGNSASSQNLISIANSNYSASTACNATRNYSVWKNRNPAIVKNGDKLWLDNFGSPGSTFPGNITTPDLEWYGFGSGLNSVKFQINSLGIVYNTTFCSLPSYTLTDVYYKLSAGGGNSTPVDYYYSSTIGAASNLKEGDILYEDSDLETPLELPSGISIKHTFYQDGTTGSTTAGNGTCAETAIIIYEDSPGIIQSIRTYSVC